MSLQLERFDPMRLIEALPVPARDANKYTRGKLTVVGGSEDYPGSVCLASKAGLFSGAGYVECVCSGIAVPLVRAFAPSLVVRAWDDAKVDGLGLTEADMRHPKACLAGSGMFADGAFQDSLVAELIEGCAVPLVLDGGALRTVAERKLCQLVCARQASGCLTALTPHGGEAAALARAADVAVPAEDATIEEIAAYARSLAEAYDACVLLKGPISFIAAPGQETVYLMDQGTPALAKAGTGDVLAGILGAFLAQGMQSVTACVLAATVHAEAGRIAAQEHGVISAIAEDVLSSIPAALLSF